MFSPGCFAPNAPVLILPAYHGTSISPDEMMALSAKGSFGLKSNQTLFIYHFSNMKCFTCKNKTNSTHSLTSTRVHTCTFACTRFHILARILKKYGYIWLNMNPSCVQHCPRLQRVTLQRDPWDDTPTDGPCSCGVEGSPEENTIAKTHENRTKNT